MAETTSQRLKRFAIEELGFDLVGISGAESLPGRTRLDAWIAQGWHGEMAWMADTAAVRGHPHRYVRGARSVVCVAMSYSDAAQPPELHGRGNRVVVARYARRKDYHDVLRPRLARLGRHLAELEPGTRWRTACDAQPLLEKELAQRAGLGWIGKNTCLINRSMGSELLLGELVTDAALEPDPPSTAHCGTCTACLDACPTAALREPYRLDARRCISYLTIEHGSALPEALTPALGSHLFGCDICQAVCPWNRRPLVRAATPLSQRAHLDHLVLHDLERLGESGWRGLSAGTPLRRLDYPRMRRNLAAVRGNIAGEGASDRDV